MKRILLFSTLLMMLLFTACQKEEADTSFIQVEQSLNPELSVEENLESLGIDVSQVSPAELKAIGKALHQDPQLARESFDEDLRAHGIDPVEFRSKPLDIDALNARMDYARKTFSIKKATSAECNRADNSHVITFASPHSTLSTADLLYLRELNFEVSGNAYFATKNQYISHGLTEPNASSITEINDDTSIIFTTDDYNILQDAIFDDCNDPQ